MKGVVLHTELGEELKGCVGTRLGILEAVRLVIPVADLRVEAEGISTLATEGMPKANREAKPFLHGLSEDNFFGIVKSEAEGIGAFWASIDDLGYVWKVG